MLNGVVDSQDYNTSTIEIDKEIFVIVKKSKLPKPLNEGDVVFRDYQKWVVDEKSTTFLKNQVKKLVNDLFI